MRPVRIGIDVGGTFTDAVALDDTTLDLLGSVKVPTTHTAREGVAAGIVQALHRLMAEVPIAPEEVRFIAHGTTQATNALLEGDVARVGIVATGSGVEGMRARSETQIGDLELAPGKWLSCAHRFAAPDEFIAAIRALQAEGAQVIVAAAPFSVDSPDTERAIMEAARNLGLPAVGTHEISSLYGLRIRTRTAAINASILPRMVETANSTEASIRETGIPAPLMIMRCDGGVMTVTQVRQRPILTLLSGPAAGVAGALMYEKVSQGLFLEVGGTSTDVSAIRNGRVMVDYAEVGGHKTYVRSLDVRTIGIAGGSMVRISGGKLSDVGPRSAHIAGLPYSVYAAPADIDSPVLETVAPLPGDPADYAVIRCARGARFALTTACAANLLGYVPAGDYAAGSVDSARRAFAPLAGALGLSVEAAAREVLKQAAARVEPTVLALLKQYELGRQETLLVGGGGGAACIVPFLAEAMAMECRLARNHEVISPIGVALALVREVVERTVVAPSPEEIQRIRREAKEAAIRSGAAEGGVEVQVEVDTTRNVVRATATGATELRTRDRGRPEPTEAELAAIAAASMGVPAATAVASVGRWHLFEGALVEKTFFGLSKRTRRRYRLLDSDGVIRLAKESIQVRRGTAATWETCLKRALTEGATFGDAGAVLPEIYVLIGSRLIDLTGAATEDQMHALAAAEISGAPPEEPLAVLFSRRKP